MTEPSDEGGDPACWAHLFDDDGLEAADLSPLVDGALAGNGVHWSLSADGDLNANLAHLDPGAEVAAHGNDEVDVLFVVLAGSGHLVSDTRTVPLHRGVAAHVAKGATRSLHASDDGLTYLTVHRRRSPLNITRPSSRGGRWRSARGGRGG